MKLIKRIEKGGLIGSLYSERLGYTFKIKAKLKSSTSPLGRYEIVGRSYCYLLHKEEAENQLEARMDELIGIIPLFNTDNYKNKGE